MTEQPIVLGFHPVRGWREASRLRRQLVAVFPLVVLTLVLVPRVAPETGLDGLVAVLPGWPSCYAVARVLRPHVGYSEERITRHAMAALATPLGAVLVLAIATGNDTAAAGLWPVPVLGLLVTVPWGIGAALTRALRRPVGQWSKPGTADRSGCCGKVVSRSASSA